MSDLIFNRINCKTKNKYIREENDLIVIDYLDEGFSFINNNKDIFCNKIEIVNGIGVLLYHDDTLVKHYGCRFVKIEFDKRFNTIILVDEEKNDNIIYIYYQNNFVPKQNKIENVLGNSKYNIGDLVYPADIGYCKTKKLDDFNSIKGSIFWEYMTQIDGFEGLKEKKMSKEMFKGLCAICVFEIVDKVDNKFYKIKLKHIDDSIKYLENKVFFATDNNLATLEEIKQGCEDFKKLKDER